MLKHPLPVCHSVGWLSGVPGGRVCGRRGRCGGRVSSPQLPPPVPALWRLCTKSSGWMGAASCLFTSSAPWPPFSYQASLYQGLRRPSGSAGERREGSSLLGLCPGEELSPLRDLQWGCRRGRARSWCLVAQQPCWGWVRRAPRHRLSRARCGAKGLAGTGPAQVRASWVPSAWPLNWHGQN